MGMDLPTNRIIFFIPVLIFYYKWFDHETNALKGRGSMGLAKNRDDQHHYRRHDSRHQHVRLLRIRIQILKNKC